MALSVERTGAASAIIRDGTNPVCEIRDLRLCNARFRRGGRPLIGEEVPLPLFWMQYANHEEPDRNGGSFPSLRILGGDAETVRIECRGTSASVAVQSTFSLTVSAAGDPPVYAYEIAARLEVPPGRSWPVTPNPSHGEVEFCNFWAEGVFSPDRSRPTRYQGTFVITGDRVHRIRHHHVESSDKQNIALRKGDRLAWLLEDENPCVTLLSDDAVTGGVCAYMWDAHLAYRICHGGKPETLGGGTILTAAFRITSMGRDEAIRFVRAARDVPAPATAETPAVLDGVHTFAVMCSDLPEREAWPWETAMLSGDPSSVRFSVDRTAGYDDDRALRIEASGPVHARWLATTLGPAYRRKPFPDGARFRLEAFVRTALTEGSADIAVRLHRGGRPGLFDPESYEIHRPRTGIEGDSPWTRLLVITPPISPAPDRLHLLLDLRGTGTCWFDNVHLTTIR